MVEIKQTGDEIMKQVPETKIKLTDVKELINKGYNLLGELREEADAPVAKAEFLTEEITTVYGEEAARKFYNPENFKREGSMLQAGRVYAKSSIENFIW